MMQQLNSNRIAPGLHDLCIKRIGKIERTDSRNFAGATFIRLKYNCANGEGFYIAPFSTSVLFNIQSSDKLIADSSYFYTGDYIFDTFIWHATAIHASKWARPDAKSEFQRDKEKSFKSGMKCRTEESSWRDRVQDIMRACGEQLIKELINRVTNWSMSDAVYSRCRQKSLSDRCELICRVSRRDRPESLSPVYLQVIPGLRMSNFGTRCKLGKLPSVLLLRLSRRTNSRKYMWLTWEMRKLAIAVSGLLYIYISAIKRAVSSSNVNGAAGLIGVARKNRIKLFTLARGCDRCQTVSIDAI